MRAILGIASGLALVAVASVPIAAQGRAADTASATVRVHATVQPNLALSATAPVMGPASAPAGDFSATINFRIDAHAQSVEVSVGATPLVKGGEQDPAAAPSIPVDTQRGVTIGPADDAPAGAHAKVALFVGREAIGDTPGRVTERVALPANRSHYFAQDLAVTVAWNRAGPARPAGTYSGKVKLMAMVLP